MKGFFSQGVAVLLEAPIGFEELESLLPEYPIVREVPGRENWEMGGHSAVVAYRPEANGYLAIDIVPHPWPDHMGSPKEEPMLFGAWGMGYFGPFAYPRGLHRATQYAWNWAEAKTRVPRHRAFVRILLSYAFGARPDSLIRPLDSNARHELEFVTKVARCVLNHQHAVCYFNPNGEVVLPAKAIDESLRYHAEHSIPPFDLWMNERLFDLTGDWLVMDSVGNWQLDMVDHEAAFPKKRFDSDEVSRFVRNASLYVLTNGDVIKDNDTMDGPGNLRWKAMNYDEAISDPPRKVICWVPLGESLIPDRILKRKLSTPPQVQGAPKAKWWQLWKKG